MASRPQRHRAQMQPYYEGYMEKMGPNEEVPRRLWTTLCGDTLFFYNTTKDTQYVERLELSGFISLVDDNSRGRNLEAARLILRMKEGDYKITVPSLEARELWKGFICSAATLSVPTFLNLLPGQIHMLREVVEQENERRKTSNLQETMTNDTYLHLIADMPPCFHQVSRHEAETLLDKYPQCGNLLLRPQRNGPSLAITTRQELNGSVFRHYRVARNADGGFVLDLENAVPCATLNEVVDYLVKKTSGMLIPFILEEAYEDHISFVHCNDENGETSVKCASPSSFSKTLTPVAGAQEVPHSTEPKPIEDASLYLNENRDELKKVKPPPIPPRVNVAVQQQELPYQNSLTTTLKEEAVGSGTEKAQPRQALMPPSHKPSLTIFMPPAPKPSLTTSTKGTNNLTLHPDNMALGLSAELKEKLEKRFQASQ